MKPALRCASLVATACLAATLAACSASPHAQPAAAARPPGDPVETRLVFTGAVTAIATKRAAPLPVQTVSSYQDGPADYTTQCTIAAPGSLAGWSAQFTVDTPGNSWSINLADDDGNPSPGRHPLAWEANPGAAVDDSLGVNIKSSGPAASGLGPVDPLGDGDEYYQYDLGTATGPVVTYYATVNPGLTSGTIDVLVSPDQSLLALTIEGTWSCD